ncbi:MAG: DNA polymerase III subunit gamma/tau [Actinomycetes bacterium]|nr:DNA polymerase III subunit gamma/tau [Actinomycetes bacterium]
MAQHRSLYLKYRPHTFAQVVGQSAIERTLKNAIATDSVTHAYLFAGPRGTGKTTSARLLAEALLCEHVTDGEPDGTCEHCRAVIDGTHPDVIEMDAASRRKLENITEEVINRVQFAPAWGSRKVYIIDEVHQLTKEAVSALLRTLEDPPDHVVFVLCTTDPQRVLSTIRSRCQEFDFHPISVADLTARLQFIADSEGFAADNAALALIARHADGGMRDAITTLERMAAFTGGSITVADVESLLGGISSDELARIARALSHRDTRACFTWVADQVDAGADLVEVTRGLLSYIRDLYVIATVGSTEALVRRSADEALQMRSLAGDFTGPDGIARLLDILAELSDKLRWTTEPRLELELALVRASRPTGDMTLAALAERIEALEAGGSASRTASVPAAIPVAETAPAAADCPIPSDPAEIKRTWRAVLAELGRLKPSRAPIFADTQAQFTASGMLQVVFPADSIPRIRRAQQAENNDLLNKAVKSIFGRELPFELIEGTESAPAREPVPVPEPAAIPAPAPTPVSEPVPEPVPAPPAPEPDVPAGDETARGDALPDDTEPLIAPDPVTINDVSDAAPTVPLPFADRLAELGAVVIDVRNDGDDTEPVEN